MNNLLGIFLRWREEQVALVGDIRKMCIKKFNLLKAFGAALSSAPVARSEDRSRS